MKILTKNEKVAVAVSIILGLGVFVLFAPGLISSLLSTKNNQGTVATPVVSSDNTSGLKIQDVVIGSGLVAGPGEIIQVRYTGKLADGTTFDSSAMHNNVPISFVLGTGSVIKGWDLGLVGMKVGGKRVLLVSPELGYGTGAYGPIPANSTLYFEVELVGIQAKK